MYRAVASLRSSDRTTFSAETATVVVTAAWLIIFSACATIRTGPAPAAQSAEEEALEEETLTTSSEVFVDLEDSLFNGTARKDAKLMMVPVSPIAYNSITAVTGLLAPTLPKPEDTAPRTGVENSAAAFTAWLYAYNMPADNDFHLIIGDTATFMPSTNFINVEIAGLPHKGDVAFKAVRVAALKVLAPKRAYTCLGTPVKVIVSGGVYWDNKHKNGGAGTTCAAENIKTKSAWEIHPVSSISFP
jgi:hypothetical protein